jgi:hypothetical protein
MDPETRQRRVPYVLSKPMYNIAMSRFYKLDRVDSAGPDRGQRRSEYPSLAANLSEASSRTCLAVMAKYEPITTAAPITRNSPPDNSTITLSAISWIGSVGGDNRISLFTDHQSRVTNHTFSNRHYFALFASQMGSRAQGFRRRRGRIRGVEPGKRRAQPTVAVPPSGHRSRTPIHESRCTNRYSRLYAAFTIH